MEYEAKHNVSMRGLLAFRDDIDYIPIHPTTITNMTDKLKAQLQAGVSNLTVRIQGAIEQVPTPRSARPVMVASASGRGRRSLPTSPPPRTPRCAAVSAVPTGGCSGGRRHPQMHRGISTASRRRMTSRRGKGAGEGTSGRGGELARGATTW